MRTVCIIIRFTSATCVYIVRHVHLRINYSILQSNFFFSVYVNKELCISLVDLFSTLDEGLISCIFYLYKNT